VTATIRRATRADAKFLAWVMLAAGRSQLDLGAWDLIIGADEAGCLDYLGRLAVAEPRSLCHYERVWPAEVDGHPWQHGIRESHASPRARSSGGVDWRTS
jgi:hypothetical protein